MATLHIERVVRTDFYLRGIKLPDLSSAWIHKGPPVGKAQPSFKIKLMSDPDLSRGEQIALLLVAQSQRGTHAQHRLLMRLDDRTKMIVRMLLKERVVLENSPPTSEMLGSLLAKATSTSLGVMVGMQMSSEPLVLLITIPTGMIVMGAAMGITKGLEQGLAVRVKKMIAGKEHKRK